jgi:MYND finger
VYESDGGDCPPLALAGDACFVMHCDASGSTAATSNNSSSSSSLSSSNSSSSSCSSSKADGGAGLKQSLQQQPCVQCGKLIKKRCRRCQAVYYCSEECQIQCFKDPKHRAECEAAAAAPVLAGEVR